MKKQTVRFKFYVPGMLALEKDFPLWKISLQKSGKVRAIRKVISSDITSVKMTCHNINVMRSSMQRIEDTLTK